MKTLVSIRSAGQPLRRLAPTLLIAALLLPALAGADSLVPHARLDHKVIRAGEPNTVYLLVEFDVARFAPPPDIGRPDLNLALVLDRSGSMEDRGKMTYARDAAMIVVDRLRRRDVLSVVEYDDQISVLWPAGPVESPESIKRLIAQLHPRGSTDLCGGMMAGCEQAARRRDGADLTRVLLLSDGLANQGVTEPREIYRLVREAKRRGVTVSTIGLGLDYNEDLMRGIAEASGGNYYYVEHPSQMGRIFTQELNTLFTTVAKDVTLRLKASRMVTDVEVVGYDFEIDGDEVLVPLENFYSEEERSVLMRLELDPARPGDLDLGELSLVYHDYLDGRDVERRLEIEAEASDDPDAVERSRDDHVVVEAALTRADARQDEIVQAYAGGDVEGAQTGMAVLAEEMRELQAAVDSPRLAAKLESFELERQDMAANVGDADGSAAYVKANKARNYQGGRGKRAYFLLEEGDQGVEVENLQQALKDRGLWTSDVDGDFTSELGEVVRAFQRSQRLDDDGRAGPMTLRALGLY